MEIIVVGKDYFAERFALLLGKLGLKFSTAPRFTRTAISGYGMVLLSGKECSSKNILSCLKEGSHVFSEQFIFEKHSEIGAVDFARENSLKLQLGFFDVFNPAVKETKKLMSSQRVFSLFFRTLGPMQPSKLNIIDDIAIQNIGISNYLLEGSQPEIISASTQDILNNCFLHLRKGRTSIFIYANKETVFKERTLSVFGQNIMIDSDISNQKLFFLDSGLGKPSLAGTGYESQKEFFIRKSEPLALALKEFISSKANPMDYGMIRQNLEAAYKAKKAIKRMPGGKACSQ